MKFLNQRAYALVLSILFSGGFSTKNSAQNYLSEDFTSSGGPTPPTGWLNQTISGQTGVDVWRFDNPGARTTYSPIQGNFAIFDSDEYSSSGGPENVALVSPGINLGGATQVLLDFDHQYNYCCGSEIFVEVYNGSSWTTVFHEDSTSVGWPLATASERRIDITTASGLSSLAKVRFRWSGNYAEFWMIDNVTVYEDPGCAAPVQLNAIAIGKNEATLTWQSTAYGSSWEVEHGQGSFTLGNGTRTTVNTTQKQLSGLSQNTNYTFYAREICGANDTSAWSSAYNFKTGSNLSCSTVITSLPYIESYEYSNGQLTTNSTGNSYWATDYNNGGRSNTGPWYNANNTGYPDYYHYLYCNSPYGDTASLESNCIDLGNATYPYLTFQYHMYGSEMGTLAVQINKSGVWSTQWSISGQQHGYYSDPYSTAFIDLSAYQGDTVQYRILGVSGGDYSEMAVDEIEVNFNAANDIGVATLLNPPQTYTPGSIPVQVNIENFGQDSLASATINWSVNGTSQTPYNLNLTGNSRVPGGSKYGPVNLGNYTFTSGTYNLKFWTSSPNGNTDEDHTNDTLETLVCAGLSGTYTVGGTGADFPSVTAAITSLEQCGVSGAVTLSLTPGAGPFAERIEISTDSIFGYSSTNNLTIQGNGETVQYFSSSVNRAVVYLNGADHVTIDSLTIKSTSSSYGWGILLSNGANYNTIKNCKIDLSGVTSTSVTNSAGLVGSAFESGYYGGNNANHNVIENNEIIRGYHGVILEANNNYSPGNRGNSIVNNTFKNQIQRGIYLSNADSANVSGNVITNPTSSNYSTQYGILLYNSVNYTISKNQIKNFYFQVTGNEQFYGIYLNNCDCGSGACEISNNMISGIETNDDFFGIYNYYSDYNNFYHNTISHVSNRIPDYFNGIYDRYGYSSNYKNNIIHIDYPSSTNTTYGFYLYSNSSNISDDYNNIYIAEKDVNEYYGYVSGNRKTLADWQFYNYRGPNNFEVNPLFTNDTILEPQNVALNNAGESSLGVTEDFYGVTRTSTPDIGAVEFTPPQVDLALTQLNLPDSACGLGLEPLTGLVINSGVQTISNFTASYRVNGGTVHSTTISTSITSGNTATITFDSLVDFSTTGQVYTIDAWVNATGDNQNSNDTIIGKTVKNLAPELISLTDSLFETGSLNSSGTSGHFANGWLGEPLNQTNYYWRIDNYYPEYLSGPYYDHTVGNNSGRFFNTETGTYLYDQVATLTSTCLQIMDTSVAAPVLEYWYHKYGNEMGDLYVEIGQNGTWTTIDSVMGQTHYDYTDPWSLKELDLDAYAGQNLKVRFKAVSAYGDDGHMALDDIKVSLKPNTCDSIKGFKVTAVTDTSVDFSWNSNRGAQNTELQWGPSGFTQGSGTTSTQSENFRIGGLTSLQGYDIYMRNTCASGSYSPWTGPFTVYPNNYCNQNLHDVNYGCTARSGISQVILDSINYTSACQGNQYSYSMVTGQSTDLTPEQSYTITLGNSSGYRTYYAVWIDYNRDGDFLDANEYLGTTGYIYSGTTNLSFTVPFTVDSGITVMRVRSDYNHLNSSQSCTFESYGETEDYIVNVLPPPSCPKPVNLGAGFNTQTSTRVFWNPRGYGSSWEIEYGFASFTKGNGTVITSTDSSKIINGLITYANYDFYVRSVCGAGDTSIWNGPYTFNTYPYCFNSLHSTGCSSTPSYDIGYVELNTLQNTTTNCFPGSFSGFTSLGTSLTQGNTYQITLGTNSSAGVNYGVWIDFNNDGDFDDAQESVVLLNNNSTTDETALIYVPVNVQPGNTVMRVRSSTYTLYSNNSCNNLTYGETEDYTVTISPVPNCVAPYNLSMSNISLHSGTVNWASHNSGSQWLVQYDTAGFTLGTGQIVNSNSTSYTINNLSGLSSYDVYLKEICSASDSSDWTGPVTFNTNPYCTTNLHYTGCGLQIDSIQFASLNYVESGQPCPTNSYHENFTPTIPVNKYSTYQLRVRGNSNDYGSIGAWIDLNADGDFSDVNEYLGYSYRAYGNLFVTNVNIPLGATLGNTVLRIRMSDDYSQSSGVSCSHLDYGETMDFMLDIQPPTSCVQPQNLSSGFNSFTSAFLNWTDHSNGMLYEIEYDTVGYTFGNGTRLTATDTFETVSGLSVDGYYDYYVRTICDTGDTSLWAGPYTFSTFPYCNGNTTTLDYSGCYYHITNVQIDTFTNNTGLTCPTNSYSVSTTPVVKVAAGSTVPISVSGNSTYPAYGMWIDYNRNGSFEDSGELVAESFRNGAKPLTANIQVPITATPGITMLRVRVNDDYSFGTLSACYTYRDGETEDYMIEILPPPSCPAPFNLATYDYSSETAMRFSFSSYGNGNAWEIKTGTPGFDPATSGVSEFWSFTDDSIRNLEPYTYYDVYVREICDTNDTSAWTGPLEFFTNPYCYKSLHTLDCQLNPDFIDSVDLNGITYTADTCSGQENNYQLFDLRNVEQFYAGQQLNFKVHLNNTSKTTAAWIDWNRDHSLSSTEYYYLGAQTGGHGNLNVNVPRNFKGNLMVRFRTSDYGFSSTYSCLNTFDGETEDYVLNVVPPVPNDAKAVKVTSPVSFCHGNHNVALQVMNVGNNQIDSLKIGWEVDGVGQPVVSYNGLLDTANGAGPDTASVNLGSVHFGANQTVSIKAWAMLPNGAIDSINLNDTLVNSLTPIPSGALGMDVALDSFAFPSNPVPSGYTSISVNMSHLGGACDTVRQVKIGWQADGQAKPPVTVNFNPPLAPYGDTTLIIGGINFSQMAKIDAYIMSVNGITDIDQSNDSLTKQFCTSLSGTYTIGGANPDFTTFTDAIEVLNCGGVTGPVTFNVAPGTYNEQVVLAEVPGADSVNTVTFNGTGTGNTIIDHTASSTNDWATIMLNGTDYVTFKEMSVYASGTSYGIGVFLTNMATHNTFDNIHVLVDTSVSTSSVNGVVSSSSTTSISGSGENAEYNTISNSTVTGGYYGIRLNGSGTTNLDRGNRVLSCTITGYYYYGIYTYYQGNFELNGNKVTHTRGNIQADGLYIYYSSDYDIRANKIVVPSVGLFLYYSNYYTQVKDINILNNMVYSSQGHAIRVDDNTTDVNIYHNSLRSDAYIALYLEYNVNGIDIRNNIIYSNLYQAVYSNATSTSAITNFDYNLLYREDAGDLAHWGNNYADLPALQTACGCNMNSIEGDPEFASSTDLHIYTGILADSAGTNLGTISDIDGDARDTLYPDIGADEYDPVLYDLALLSDFEASTCKTGSDTLYFEVLNAAPGTLDFSARSFTLTAHLTGPTGSSTVSTSINSGTLNPGDTISVKTYGHDLSKLGEYNIDAWLSSTWDSLQINDSLIAKTFDVLPMINALPDTTVEIFNNTDSVEISSPTANSTLLEESFDTGSLPAGWLNTNDALSSSSNAFWKFTGTPGYAMDPTYDHTGNGGSYAWVDGSTDNNLTSTLESPAINVSGVSTITLSFWIKSDIGTFSTTHNTFSIDVYDGSTWNTNVFTFSQNTTNGAWEQFFVDVSPYLGGSAIQLRFNVGQYGSTPFRNDIALDDIKLSAPASNAWWTRNGTFVDSASSVIVGPWNSNDNGLHQYVINQNTQCGLATDTVNIDVNIPTDEVSVVQILHPEGGCNIDTAKVTAEICNNGNNAQSNMPVYVSINGTVTTVSVGSLPAFSCDTIELISSLPTNNSDTVFDISVYTALTGDLDRSNDTASVEGIAFTGPPAPPVVRHDTVCMSNGTATLIASATDDIIWYNTPTGGSAVGTGDTLTISNVTANDTVYAQAGGTYQYNYASGIVPIPGSGSPSGPASINIPAPSALPNTSNITLTVESWGDLASTNEFFTIEGENAYIIGNAGVNGSDCPISPVVETFTVPTSLFAQWAADGTIQITVTATSNFNPTLCSIEPSGIEIKMNFTATNPCFNPNRAPAYITYNSINVDSVITKDPTACTSQDGEIEVFASGSGTLSYSINGGQGFQSSNVFSNLGEVPDGYDIAVRNNICSVSGPNVSLTKPNAPAPPAMPGNATYCEGESMAHLVATPDTSATEVRWYADPYLTNQVGTDSILPLDTTSTLTYYATQVDSGCEGQAGSVDVTIIPKPATTVNHDTSVCAGTEVTLEATVPNNSSFSYSSGIVSPAGTSTPVVVQVNNPPQPASSSITITIESWGDINGTGTNPENYVVEGENGYYLGQTSPGTQCGTAANVDQFTVPASVFNQWRGNGVIEITATPSSAVNPTLCSGAGVHNGVEVIISYATASGNWYADAGLTNLIGSGISTTVVDTAAISHTYYFGYIDPVSGCHNGPDSVTVTWQPTPASPSVADQTYCEGDSIVPFIPTGAGGTFNFYEDISLSIPVAEDTSQFLSPLTTSGYEDYYVTEIGPNGCESAIPTPVSIAINTRPQSANLGPGINYCAGDSVLPISPSPIPGTTLNWYADAAGTNQIGTGSITPADTTGTTTYYAAINNGQCDGAVDSITVTISPYPATPTVTGGGSYCEHDTMQLTATGVTAGVNWYLNRERTNQVGTGTTFTPLLNVNDTTVYYAAQNQNGCESAGLDSAAVFIKPAPVITGTLNQAVCVGDTAILSVNGGQSYQWSTSETGPTITTAPIVTTNYTVTVTNSQNCSNTRDILVTVDTLPTVTATVSNDSICKGNSATLSTAEAGTSTFYTWSTGSSGRTQVVTPLHSEVYYVTATNFLGCSNTDSVAVHLHQLPAANAGEDTTVCLGDQAVLTATGGATNNDYAWSSGHSFYSIAVMPSQPTDYIVTVTDANGCTDEDTVQVGTHNLPAVDAGSNTAVCAGSSVSLTATGATSYTWNTGANSPGITVSPLAQTKYFVTGTGANSCSNLDSVTVSVNPLPVVQTSNDTAICVNDSIELIAYGNGQYNWSTGGITSSIDVSPLSTTSYVVTATDGNGCMSTDSVNVSVNPLPQVDAGKDTAICPGDSTVLMASGGSAYSWGTGESGSSIAVSPATTNSYSVTATDQNQCSAFDSVEVLVRQLPTVDAGQDQNICKNSTSTLTATGNGTFAWNTGDSTASITPVISDTTAFFVTVTGTHGCKNHDSVTVNTLPLPQANAGLDTSVCDGDAATLTATGGTNYVWSSGGNSSTEVVAPTSTAKYTVTVTDTNNCSATDSVEVSILPLPTAEAGQNDTICFGDQGTLNASGGNGYQWSTGTSVASLTASPASNTSYTVTVTDLNGCAATDSATIIVNALPPANAGTDVAICTGDTATLTATGGTNYSWNNGPQVATVNVHPSTSTGYAVTVTDANNCSASDSVQVTVNALPVIDAGVDTSICSGSSVNLSAAGGAGYAWSNGGMTGTISISPASTTTYTVTGTDANTCKNTDSVEVVILALPTAQTGPDQTICFGDSAVLTASGGTSYNWSNSMSGPSIQVAPGNNTMYTVTVTDANGCPDQTSVEVIVNSLPSVSLSQLGSACENDAPVTLSGGIPAGGFFSGPFVSGSQFLPASAGAGTYTIYYVVTNSQGCTDSVGQPFSVHSVPAVNLNFVDEYCVNESSVKLKGGTPVNGSYSGSNVSGGSFHPSSAGIGLHQVTYTFTSSNGCSASAKDSIVVNGLPKPKLGNDTTVCLNRPFMLNPGQFSSYNWNTGATSQTVTATEARNYAVTVSDTNGCENSGDIDVSIDVCPGIAEATAPGFDVLIYPNPAHDVVSVRFNGAQLTETTVEITDLSGAVVQTTVFKYIKTSQVKEIEVGHLSQGMYLVRITNGHGFALNKLTVQ